jgi:2-iminobutanoate/2-iminopropanoate deaminase|tara:strand:- start:971 stop:1126 length:156 start_codon:yes stop_codon:yes gene_type:complete
MLSDIKDWPEMSKTYKTYFEKDKLSARSAFAGSGLALNTRIEIECSATLKK